MNRGMAMTIADLLEVAHLGTTLHAGATGTGNEVRWAHVCDMPDPAEWLGPGDLVLSTGRGIPATPADQERFVERLSAAGIAGIAISADMHAPAIDPLMVRAADRCALPVMLTEFEVPFVALSRAVAEANQEILRAGAERTQLLYNAVLRATVKRADEESLLATLGKILQCDLSVVDGETGRSFEAFPGPPDGLTELVRARASTGSLAAPAVFRLSWDDRPVVGMVIPATRPAVLVAVGRAASHLDSTLLAHVSTITALELERLWTARDRRRQAGAEILLDLVDGTLGLQSAAASLREHGLDDERLRLLAGGSSAGGPPAAHPQLHHRLADRGVAHLLAERDDLLFVLVPADDEQLAIVRAELDPAVAVGVSDTLDRGSHVPDALHEAQLALQGAQHAEAMMATYGEDSSLVPFLPATLTEARRVADVVLGALVRYDDANGTQLLPSLRAFLVHNRSWTRSAEALHVHKQTLVYRMRRVEEVTGRRLDRTQDVVELWLGLRAHDLVGAPASRAG